MLFLLFSFLYCIGKIKLLSCHLMFCSSSKVTTTTSSSIVIWLNLNYMLSWFSISFIWVSGYWFLWHQLLVFNCTAILLGRYCSFMFFMLYYVVATWLEGSCWLVLRSLISLVIFGSFQMMMMMNEMWKSRVVFFSLLVLATFQQAVSDEHQPLSKVSIHKTTLALDEHAYIKATPNVLGLKVSFDCTFENFEFSFIF